VPFYALMARAEKGIDPRLIDGSWRVVLPKEAIAALKVKQGDHVAFVVTEGRVEIRKVKLSLD
jgi:bifunctional DNA-binding transcriptional regulator/antitoxin component of YhaV-PrlF toxin-antitoxin module